MRYETKNLYHFFEDIENELELDQQYPLQSESKFVTLKNECATRWTSLFTMLKSVKSNLHVIEIVLLKMKKIDLIRNEDETELLNEMITFLELFNISTN